MSADKKRHAPLTILLLAVCSPVVAADDDVPELEFLEYLGMWEESDEEWLVLEEPVAQLEKERNDPVPEGKESTEKDDES